MKLCKTFNVKLLVFVLIFPFLATDSFAIASSNKKNIARGKKATQDFFAGKLTELYKNFSPTMKKAMNINAFQDFRKAIIAEIGQEKELKQENLYPFLETFTYERLSTFEKQKDIFAFRWVFTESGAISGMSFEKHSDVPKSQFSEYSTLTSLRLPFQDEWLVFWGGRKLIENYHVKYPSQRFAYDFVIAKHNHTFSGNGDKNEDFFCFGKEIVAPASGIVTFTADGVPDNKPGIMNPKQAFGNFVVIDHENGEYSVFCHLKNGSIKVAKGQKISTGDCIGLCGNSGNSSEAHLHYHLQNSADFSAALSIPAKFKFYYSNKKLVNSGEPGRGSFVNTSPAE